VLKSSLMEDRGHMAPESSIATQMTADMTIAVTRSFWIVIFYSQSWYG